LPSNSITNSGHIGVNDTRIFTQIKGIDTKRICEKRLEKYKYKYAVAYYIGHLA
jgi:hypothetical protein